MDSLTMIIIIMVICYILNSITNIIISSIDKRSCFFFVFVFLNVINYFNCFYLTITYVYIRVNERVCVCVCVSLCVCVCVCARVTIDF